MAIIHLEIVSCQQCPKKNERNQWSSDGFDRMIDWYCTEANRVIAGSVEWKDKVKIPDWCPLLCKERSCINTAKRDIPQSIIDFAEKTGLDDLPKMYASGEVQDESNEYSLEFLNDDDITKPYFVVDSWGIGTNCGFATEEEAIEDVKQSLNRTSDMYHVDVYKFPEGYKMDFNISLVRSFESEEEFESDDD